MRSNSADRALSPGFVQRAVDTAQQPGPTAAWAPFTEPIAGTPAPAAAGPSTTQRRIEASVEPVEPKEVAPLVSDSAPLASVAHPATMPSVEPVTRSGSARPSPLPGFVQRAVDAFLQRGQRPMWSPSAQPAATTPMPIAAAPSGAAPSAVPAVESREVAPLVSDSEPMASVVIRSPGSSSPASPTRSTDEGLAVQRAADTAPPTAELPLAHLDHPVVGLVGDRPIEPAVPDYGAAIESAGESTGGSVAAPRTAEGRVARTDSSAPRAPATTAVQRSVDVGAYSAPRRPLGPPAVRRSFPAAEPQVSPSQPIQFVQFVPAAMPTMAASHPPQQSTELVVQRAADEPSATSAPATTDPAAATGAAGAAAPGQPTGSTSPTEIDNLVRRLYEPIVRRLKAELQLDRERAGRSLDLWH